MAYCSVEDVYLIGVHGGFTFTNTQDSVPSLDQVNDAIDRIYIKINSMLNSCGVIVPINQTTSPLAYDLVNRLNAVGAAAAAEAVAWNELSAKSVDSGYTPGSFKKEFDSLLKSYVEYPIRLRDAVLSPFHPTLFTAESTGTPYNTASERYDFTYWQNNLDKKLEIFRQDDQWG